METKITLTPWLGKLSPKDRKEVLLLLASKIGIDEILLTSYGYSIAIVDQPLAAGTKKYGVCRLGYAGIAWCDSDTGKTDFDQARILTDVLGEVPRKITRLDISMSSAYCLRCLKEGTGEGVLTEITGWAKGWLPSQDPKRLPSQDPKRLPSQDPKRLPSQDSEEWKKAGGGKVSKITQEMVETIMTLMKRGVIIVLHRATRDSKEEVVISAYRMLLDSPINGPKVSTIRKTN
jgi:hypothetical protein